jgi:hypothetical protein
MKITKKMFLYRLNYGIYYQVVIHIFCNGRWITTKSKTGLIYNSLNSVIV